MSSKGNLIVLSAPSGSGKTSLASRVLEELPGLKFSVSHTTRKPRTGERYGVEYYFVSEPEFKEMIGSEAFLEYAFVYGHYYGTSKEFVEGALESGDDVLLDIDVQGAMNIKNLVPDAVMVFVLPPSLEVLQSRLRLRALDEGSSIERRLENAKQEIGYYKDYGYIIINEDIETSVLELKSIILAARCRAHKRTQQAGRIVKTFIDDRVVKEKQ